MNRVACVMLAGLLMGPGAAFAQQDIPAAEPAPAGDAARGRLVFGPCRTCHYAEAFMGHNNGPNLNRIFGKVAGKQPGFDYYSARFTDAEFVWTPQFMYLWLADPQKMFPDSSMMSLGVPDPQRRADLIAFLKLTSMRGPDPDVSDSEH